MWLVGAYSVCSRDSMVSREMFACRGSRAYMKKQHETESGLG